MGSGCGESALAPFAKGGDEDNRHSLEQWDHVGPGFQRIGIVRPRLHHLAPLGQVPREVVGRAHGVALGMRKLALDDLMVPASLSRKPGLTQRGAEDT